MWPGGVLFGRKNRCTSLRFLPYLVGFRWHFGSKCVTLVVAHVALWYKAASNISSGTAFIVFEGISFFGFKVAVSGMVAV
jgi:hypothetical protein